MWEVRAFLHFRLTRQVPQTNRDSSGFSVKGHSSNLYAYGPTLTALIRVLEPGFLRSRFGFDPSSKLLYSTGFFTNGFFLTYFLLIPVLLTLLFFFLGDATRRNTPDADQLAADGRRGGLYRQRLRCQGIFRARTLPRSCRARRCEYTGSPAASRDRWRDSGIREL